MAQATLSVFYDPSPSRTPTMIHPLGWSDDEQGSEIDQFLREARNAGHVPSCNPLPCRTLLESIEQNDPWPVYDYDKHTRRLRS